MESEFIVLVTGSRDWDDYDVIEKELTNIPIPSGCNPVLVHGGCFSGADYIAHKIGNKLGWKIKTHLADWSKYGNRAGPIRNNHMVTTERPHAALAFCKNKSKGTSGCIKEIKTYQNTLLNRLEYFKIINKEN